MSDKEQLQTSEYNYPRFHRGLMIEQFEGGPEPGQPAPDFAAWALDGEKIRLSDFRDLRHVVLQFGSVT